MCIPALMGAAGAASAGTMMQAMASVVSGIMQAQQASYEAGVARYNARQAENEAIRTRNKGVEQENIQREKTAQLLAKQRAALGAAGVNLASGSPLQLQEDTELLGEIDARRIKSNYELQAQSLDEEAELKYGEARAKQRAGTFALLGSALTAGGQVASKWYGNVNQAGVYTGSQATSLTHSRLGPFNIPRYNTNTLALAP